MFLLFNSSLHLNVKKGIVSLSRKASKNIQMDQGRYSYTYQNSYKEMDSNPSSKFKPISSLLPKIKGTYCTSITNVIHSLSLWIAHGNIIIIWMKYNIVALLWLAAVTFKRPHSLIPTWGWQDWSERESVREGGRERAFVDMRVCVCGGGTVWSCRSLEGVWFRPSCSKSPFYCHKHSLGMAVAQKPQRHLEGFTRSSVEGGCKVQQRLGTQPCYHQNSPRPEPEITCTPPCAHKGHNPDSHACNR